MFCLFVFLFCNNFPNVNEGLGFWSFCLWCVEKYVKTGPDRGTAPTHRSEPEPEILWPDNDKAGGRKRRKRREGRKGWKGGEREERGGTEPEERGVVGW